MISGTEQIPFPPWDRYLKDVSRLSLSEENKEYRDFLKSLTPPDTLNDEYIQKIQEAFVKMTPEEIKKKLNSAKKREIDAIRRRLIPVKKKLADNTPLPTHLNLTILRFIPEDIGLLIRANNEHFK